MNFPLEPAVDAPFGVMTAGLTKLHEAIEELLGADPLQLADGLLLPCLRELERGIRRLPATRHQLVAEIDARGIAADCQVRSTAVLLRESMRLSRGEAGQWVKQASEQVGKRDLTTGQQRAPKRASVAASVKAGLLSGEQVNTISVTMRQVPAAVSAEQRDRLEADLVRHALDLQPEQLTAVCKHALRVLDEDGPEPSETEKEAKVGLFFGKTRIDGLTPFHGIADEETKAALLAALVPLAKPVKSETGRDTRSQPTRMLHGLRDLALRALASGKLPSLAGLPATLLLSTTLEQLEARTGLVSVLNGGTVPVDYVIRMAAEMKVVPIVFSAAGETLYCGRAERFATLPIRLTNAAQDRGCVIPGCDQPIWFCEHHHFQEFSQGGETNADQMGWLCRYHHRRIDEWFLERRGGRVWCTAPPWLDPTQTPRLNNYFYPPELIPENELHAATEKNVKIPTDLFTSHH